MMLQQSDSGLNADKKSNSWLQDCSYLFHLCCIVELYGNEYMYVNGYKHFSLNIYIWVRDGCSTGDHISNVQHPVVYCISACHQRLLFIKSPFRTPYIVNCYFLREQFFCGAVYSLFFFFRCFITMWQSTYCPI